VLQELDSLRQEDSTTRVVYAIVVVPWGIFLKLARIDTPMMFFKSQCDFVNVNDN